jgi:hypothetical protein
LMAVEQSHEHRTKRSIVQCQRAVKCTFCSYKGSVMEAEHSEMPLRPSDRAAD